MQRAVASGLVAVGLSFLACVAPSCARGDDEPATEVSPVVTVDGSVEVVCAPCAPGEKCSAGVCMSVTVDADRDGFALAIDCDDHDPAIHPSAPEVCNGKDDDCNGKVDEPFDLDLDGTPTCALGGNVADCDDKDPAIHPGAAEVCNFKDDDCDGAIDDAFDKDNDGYYTCAHGPIAADCNDAEPTIHPLGIEICNAKDDDCDGATDELPAILSGSLAVPVNPHWATAGAATIVNGWAQLTQDVYSQAGAVWWNANYLFDTFDVSGTFWIQPNSNGADGMAFAWISGSNLNQLGIGPTYGAGGLPGYAVAIDTYQNAGEPAPPFLTVYEAVTDRQLARATIPNVRDSQNHRLRVHLEGGKVSAWIDGINYIFDFPLPGYAPFIGHWGFTGGTGGLSEAHWVTNVTMSFPNGQGCVP